jgi:hypothetical protein
MVWSMRLREKEAATMMFTLGGKEKVRLNAAAAGERTSGTLKNGEGVSNSEASPAPSLAPVRCRACGTIRPNLEGPLIVDVGGFRHRVDFFCRDCVSSGLCERRGTELLREMSSGQ